VNDRSYYRTLPLRALIEAGLRSDNELALALAERLDETEHELEEGARKDFKALSEAYDEVCAEVEDLKYELQQKQHTYEG